jgi:hypothetical protein
MANISQEKGIMVSLAFKAAQDPKLRNQPRFDPTLVTRLVSGTGQTEDGGTLFLRSTSPLLIPGMYTEVVGGRHKTERHRNIGHKTLAIFDESGPGISRETTGGIIHHGSDLGLWLRRPTEPELKPLVEDFGSAHAWVFEVLMPLEDRDDSLVATGLVSEPFIPMAL